MKKTKVYANIHSAVHKCVGSALFPFIFAAFFLLCAAVLLAASGLLSDAAREGRADFHAVCRLVPMMTDASALTAVLAVGGGAFLERLRRE